MQVYLLQRSMDAAGPYAVVGIFADGFDPGARDFLGLLTHQPLDKYTVRAIPADSAGTEELDDQQRAEHIAQAMFSRGVQQGRDRLAALARRQALAQAAASYDGRAFPL